MTTENTAPETTEVLENVEEVEQASEQSESEESEAPSFEEWAKNQESGEGEAEKDAEEQPEEEAQPEAEAKEVWKLKVNGKEIDFDPSDTEKVKAEVQRGLAAQQKFQEAARVRNQAQSFIKALQEDPAKVLSHPSLGINLREWAENYLYQQLQDDAMSPEEKQIRNERAELERYRQTEQERKQQEETEKMERLKSEYRENYQQQFIEALNESGIPKNDWSVKRMADYMREAIRRGSSNITPKDIAPLVKQDWETAQRDLVSSLDGDQLIAMLGKETAEKIRKHQVAQAQANNPFKTKKLHTKTKHKDITKPKYGSVYDMIEDL